MDLKDIEERNWRLNIYQKDSLSTRKEKFRTGWEAHDRLVYYKFKEDPNVYGICLQVREKMSFIYTDIILHRF